MDVWLRRNHLNWFQVAMQKPIELAFASLQRRFFLMGPMANGHVIGSRPRISAKNALKSMERKKVGGMKGFLPAHTTSQ